jgi:exopolysaccharide biosynthesis polyprenyl glycosylphosphotransferase
MTPVGGEAEAAMIERLDKSPSTMVSAETVDRPRLVAVRTHRRVEPGRRSQRWLQMLAADAVAVAGATVLVAMMYGRIEGEPLQLSLDLVVVMVVCFVGALAVSGSYGRFAGALVISWTFQGVGVVHSLSLGVVLALLTAQAPFSVGAEGLRVEQAVLVALLGAAAIPAARLFASVLVPTRRQVRRVIILGSGRVAGSVAARLRRCPNVSVVGMVDSHPADTSGVLGAHADLPELCARYGVHDVVVAFSKRPVQETLELLRGLERRVSVWVVPRLYELVSWRSMIGELHGLPLVEVAPAQVGLAARVLKRVFDLVVASALLLLLSPLFAAVAGAIKLTSPGPVMFRQFRSGRDSQPFRIYKFRTMHVDAEQQRAALAQYNDVDGPIFKLKQDPRVTRVGNWLRQTSIDELPQLINVLRGEMALVGPRPFPIDESEKITGPATIRFSVPPGMTGLWQISGRNALTFDELTHLDYVYAASWSFLWDLRILLQTPASVLGRRGVL